MFRKGLKDIEKNITKAVKSELVREARSQVKQAVKHGMQAAKHAGKPAAKPPQAAPAAAAPAAVPPEAAPAACPVKPTPQQPPAATAAPPPAAGTKPSSTATTAHQPRPTGTPLPPPQASQCDEAYFQNWLQQLVSSLDLPVFDDNVLTDVLREIQAAYQAKQAATKTKEDLEKKKASQPEIDNAQKAIDAASASLDAGLGTAVDIGTDILQQDGFARHLLDTSYDDANLLTATIIRQATPKQLAAWCQNGQQEQILEFLHNVPMMRTLLQSGGAANGEYARCLQLYEQLHCNVPKQDEVLDRLALAVCLELCVNVELFDRKHQYIDPVPRYVHFEQAYLLGELDPVFAGFSVWELRHVVNCDATDDQMGWGRQCNMNYRPDWVLTDDVQWRYCRLVRTDVAYKNPEWTSEPRTYDQILAGGGKCGPRAWYGRFACKIFGIPTWGVRQPGHAAMTRWTRNGWMTCLGAGFQYSWWQDRGGLDFLLETQARGALASEGDYMEQVQRLEWVAALRGENNTTILKDAIPADPASPWYALSLVQRKRLAPHDRQVLQHDLARSTRTVTKLETLQQAPPVCEPVVQLHNQIVVPAAACSKPAKSTQEVQFMKSFLGGQQLFLSKAAVLEYELDAVLLPRTPQTYNVTLHYCGVHHKLQPLSLTVVTADTQKKTYNIDIVNTKGMWQETRPVAIQLGGGDAAKSTTLLLSRQDEPFGISIKELTLTPS